MTAKRQDSLAATYRSRSTHRQEYPHSFSYQPLTLSSVPSTTLVLFASMMHECGLPMKSDDTSSSSVYSRMPFMGPLDAAALNAAFASATVTVFSTTTVRSVNDTSGVGTRTE